MDSVVYDPVAHEPIGYVRLVYDPMVCGACSWRCDTDTAPIVGYQTFYPMPSEPPPVDLGLLPRLLGYRLRLAQRAVFADFRRKVGDAEIGPGLFGIIEIVAANPGIKQTTLAIALGVDRSTLVPALNRLERRRLLTRRTSLEDRRSNGLHLTMEGLRHLRVLRRRVSRHESRLAVRLTPDERLVLMSLLEKLCTEAL